VIRRCPPLLPHFSAEEDEDDDFADGEMEEHASRAATAHLRESHMKKKAFMDKCIDPEAKLEYANGRWIGGKQAARPRLSAAGFVLEFVRRMCFFGTHRPVR
jgi:hypothetical protein